MWGLPAIDVSRRHSVSLSLSFVGLSVGLPCLVREREAKDKEWEEKKAAKKAEEKKEKRRREKAGSDDDQVRCVAHFQTSSRADDRS